MRANTRYPMNRFSPTVRVVPSRLTKVRFRVRPPQFVDVMGNSGRILEAVRLVEDILNEGCMVGSGILSNAASFDGRIEGEEIGICILGAASEAGGEGSILARESLPCNGCSSGCFCGSGGR